MSMKFKKRGRVVAIYGINNLGKSEQSRRLANKMAGEKDGERAVILRKYPLYDLRPFGPAINLYLRGGNPNKLSPREFQLLQIANRTQADHHNRNLVAGGDYLVLEDYWGTGVAWGVGAGSEMELLISLNKHLLKEDVAILLDGKRFSEGRERGHRHEEDDELTLKVREAHLVLAERFGWRLVDANQTREKVHEEIWSVVLPLL